MSFDPIEDGVMRADASHHADMIASNVYERFGYTISRNGRLQIAATLYSEMRNAKEDSEHAKAKESSMNNKSKL